MQSAMSKGWRPIRPLLTQRTGGPFSPMADRSGRCLRDGAVHRPDGQGGCSELQILATTSSFKDSGSSECTDPRSADRPCAGVGDRGRTAWVTSPLSERGPPAPAHRYRPPRNPHAHHALAHGRSRCCSPAPIGSATNPTPCRSNLAAAMRTAPEAIGPGIEAPQCRAVRRSRHV